MRRTFAAFLLVLAVGSSARGESLVGSVPALSVADWQAQPEATSLADLRGRVVLLLLDGAWMPADEKAAQRWNDLRAAYVAKGLRVVAAVPKKVGEALPAWVEFSVAVGALEAPAAAPQALLVAADGKVAWQGEPGELPEALLVKLLRKARPFVLPRLDPAVKGAAALFKKGKLVEARALAETLDHADAKKVTDRVDALLAYWKRQIERAGAAENVAEKAVFVKWIAKHAAGSPDANTAAHELKQMKADKAAAREISAAATYVRLRADFVKTKGKRKKIDALVKKGERFMERYAGTRGAARAERLVASIKTDPAVAALKSFIAKEKIDTGGSRWRTQLPRPPEAPFSKDREYCWHLETSEGRIRLRLFPDAAPMHCSSLVYLTELGFFDGLTFHRVISGFMAQGGCPAGSGSGDPGYKFDGEIDDSRKHDRAGILSAANAGPGTDGSQFFITFGPASHLDGKHTVYGEVIDGMKTLKKLDKLGTAGGSPKARVVIEKATISVE